MKPKLTRREILQIAGGSALGLLLSPLPWKLIDDSAVWTQDWPGVPQPKHGDISYKFTTCSLCSASCGLKLRCVGQQPISAAGISQHPLNSGVICSTGILAHHLRYHPARLKVPVKFLRNAKASASLSVDDAMREISVAHGNVVIVDGRPERTASSLYRQIAEKNSAMKYIPLYSSGIDTLSTMSGKSVYAGFDIENAKTILSFGSPLFDGWGSPSRAAKFLENHQNIIQIESNHSRSAQFAISWIPIHPDMDILFALGVAHTIVKENLYDKRAVAGIKDFQEFTNFILSFSPEKVAEYIGVKAEIIRKTATTLINNTPSIALIGSDAQHPSIEVQAVVMMLNILAGSIGKTGGVLLRQEIPNASDKNDSYNSIYNLPDHSIRILILDESLSGSPISNTILQQKLSEDGIIISLSPFATARSFAMQYVIPSSVVFETLTDVTGASDRSASSLSISAALLPTPEGTMGAIRFAQRLAQALGVSIESGTTEESLKKRIAALYQSKRGSVFNASTGQTAEVKSLSSSDDLWNALIAGGCWIDNTTSTKSLPEVSLMPQLSRITIDSYKQKREQLFVQTERHAYNGNDISPLMSKVRRESKLRQENEM
jgi:anaerobic selenocysteine-containing dehydrogenase